MKIKKSEFSRTESGNVKRKPDDIRYNTVHGLPLIPPTRLGFEQGDMMKVTYEMSDGRVIIYERLEDGD